MTDWDFGKLPKRINIGTKAVPAYAYPALTAEGETVALKLFSSEREAKARHRDGIRGLMMIRMRPAINAVGALPVFRLGAVGAYMAFGGERDELSRDVPVRAAMDACLGGEEIPADQKAFHQRVAEGAQNLQATARLVQHLVDELLVKAGELLPLVERLHDEGHGAAYDDIMAQLGYLIFPGFVAGTATEHLRQYPRYFEAIRVRIDRLYLKVARDTERMEKVIPHQKRWVAHRDDEDSQSLDREELDRYRWMLEEFRISVFAQQVKTAYPVSAKRLETQWEKVIQACCEGTIAG